MKAIKADPIEIRKLFGAYEFIIPEFQRPYTWDTDNCDKLWEDIESFMDSCIENNNKNDRYFLGSIVVYKTDQNEDVWSVVDGQQRLTTLFLLAKVLYDSNVSYEVLKNMIYKKNKKTDLASEDLRLHSKVQTGDSGDFESIMKRGEPSKVGSKSSFNLNYERLKTNFKYWLGRNRDKCDDFIESFLGQVVLLPIECDSEEDALTLFQIVNDRGASLSDADIFKAKIYKAAGQDCKSFIGRWEDLGKDIDGLFRNFMHVSRAKRDYAGKEIALRKYMEDHHLGRNHQLESNWDSIVCNLENTYKILYEQEDTCSIIEQSNYDWVYWKILLQYPNSYCQYPPIVFLHKYGKRNNEGEFLVLDKKQDEYIALLKNTVRYFFIKGVVHNAVNTVKDTAYRACCAIYQGRDYINEYEENSAKDKGKFLEKLESSDCGKCKRGLVVLNSFLNDDQDSADYRKLLSGKYDIEHILPKQWAHYDKWDEDSYNENLEKIGNLMPLEKKCNIRASNEFFQRKQAEYKKSKVKDALDLSDKDPKTWYPEDVKKRHEESVKRLWEFFKDFK